MGQHARFSPSNSKRWLTCSQSMLLLAKPERGQTEFANRGTSLHAMAEDILLGNEIKETYEGYTPDEDDISLTVIPYVEYVTELPVTHKWIEHRVHLTDDCYGTADFIGYDSNTQTLHVADLKAGKGVMVYAQNNTQARIYAIGAIRFLMGQGFEEPKKVVTHIIQPGINNYGVEEVPVQELKDLFAEVKSTINMIKNGEGQYAPSEEACRWCPHKIDCPKLNEMAVQAAKNEFEDNTPLSEKMKLVAPLKLFIKEVEEESLRILGDGKELPGFKLVRGRGSRGWKSEDRIETALFNAEIEPSLYLTPTKVLSVAQLEKSLKKAKVDFDLSEFIEKKEGAPKIAPEDNPRKEINKTEEAKDAFKDA